MGKIHYLYANKDFIKTNPNNAIFKTLYGFDKRISDRKAETINKFDNVITETIIFDVDNPENVECALSDADKIIKYLSDKYNAEVNVYYTGKKGVHIAVPLEKPLKLSLIDNPNAKIKIVKAYELLLNEIKKELDIKSDVDKSLNEANRLIQMPNVKKNNEKGRTYKICIGKCRDLNKIRSFGNENNNISDPQTYKNSEFAEHLKELDKSNYIPTLDNSKKSNNKANRIKSDVQSIKTNDSIETVIISDEDKRIFVDVYNALLKNNQNQGRHQIIFNIGSSLNGYLTLNQAVSILETLENETDISESDNYYNSFIDAFKNDKEPNNIGILYKKLKTNDIALFNRLNDVLLTYQKQNNDVKTKKNYESFKELLNQYNNDVVKLFDDKLVTYRRNSKQLFKGVIYSLSSSMGLMSQIVNINAPSGSGKTEYVKTLSSMMPNFEMKGGGTAKSLYREDDEHFNLKSIYLGDWGLITDDDEKESIIKIFRELMTDNETNYTITASNNEDKLTFTLKAEALTLFITELYTKKYQFGLGEQLVNKSQNININELTKKDIIEICVLRENGKTDDLFRIMHKDYVKYLIGNSERIVLNQEIIEALFDNNMRTLEMDIVYYKMFCLYFGYDANDIANVDEYRKFFENEKLTKIEQTWFNLLEKNFDKITSEDAGYEIPHEHIINSATTKDKEYHYFTVKRLKTYLNMRIKNNKTLNQSVDYLSDILNVLLKKGYIAYTFAEDFGSERIYYLLNDEE